MIYNIVLVSGVEKSDSVIHIHISILNQILCPFSLFLMKLDFMEVDRCYMEKGSGANVFG